MKTYNLSVINKIKYIERKYNLSEINKDIYSEKNYSDLLCDLDILKEQIKRVYARKKDLGIEFGENPNDFDDVKKIKLIEISPEFIIFEFEDNKFLFKREQLNSTELFNDLWEKVYCNYLEQRKKRREEIAKMKEEKMKRYNLYLKLKEEFK